LHLKANNSPGLFHPEYRRRDWLRGRYSRLRFGAQAGAALLFVGAERFTQGEIKTDLWDDFAFATRDGLIADPIKVTDRETIAQRDLEGWGWSGWWDVYAPTRRRRSEYAPDGCRGGLTDPARDGLIADPIKVTDRETIAQRDLEGEHTEVCFDFTPSHRYLSPLRLIWLVRCLCPDAETKKWICAGRLPWIQPAPSDPHRRRWPL
jgi:hypothetical protein